MTIKSVVGAVVCATIATGLFQWLTTLVFDPSSCYEFRLTYYGTRDGYSVVPASMC